MACEVERKVVMFGLARSQLSHISWHSVGFPPKTLHQDTTVHVRTTDMGLVGHLEGVVDSATLPNAKS